MSPKSHPLARARKAKGLSQLQLGRLLYPEEVGDDERLKSKIQKRISLLETAIELPTEAEIDKLAVILAVPVEEMREWFKREPCSAAELFEDLAASPFPCLVAACFSGLPRTTGNEAMDQLLAGIRHKVALAMYCPYPKKIDPDASADEDVYFLEYAYARSRMDADAHYTRLLYQLPEVDRQKKLALYLPWDPDPINTVLPPNSTRYTLIVRFSEGGTLTQRLYIWVESERKNDLFLVGSISDTNPNEQLRVWSAYFGAPVRSWIQSQGAALPGERESRRIGFWVRDFPT